MSIDPGAQEAIILLAFGPCVVIVIVGTGCTLGRAPRTKETLLDFRERCRVTRHSRVFRGLTGCQRTPRFWGVTPQNSINQCLFSYEDDNSQMYMRISLEHPHITLRKGYTAFLPQTIITKGFVNPRNPIPHLINISFLNYYFSHPCPCFACYVMKKVQPMMN